MAVLCNILCMICIVIIIKDFGICHGSQQKNSNVDDDDIIHFPTDTMVFHKRKSEQMCDEYVKLVCGNNRQNRVRRSEVLRKREIVGGQEANPKEYPHMALVGYGSKPNIRWLCGGSLISNRFVLSAAHCAYSFSLGPAQWVRLGELILYQTTDDASPVDFQIVERIVHPDYRNTSIYYDIVLFKIERDVTFSSYIRPICVYTNDDIGIMNFPTATGWGQTDIGDPTSDSLQKVDLEFIPIDRCATNYGTDSKFQRGLDVKAMMCAGSSSGGRDTCLGDSGGPLTIKMSSCSSMYYQIGITSFGRSCAVADTPGVYTKVSFYVQWIESVVWK